MSPDRRSRAFGVIREQTMKTAIRRAVLVTVVVLLARVVSAQSIALAPAQVDAVVKAGQPARFEFSVANPGDQPVAIRSTVTDLWYNEKNEKTFGPAGSSPHSAANWIQFVPRLVTIPAKSSAKLTAFITPPPDAIGGYYAVAFVESKPELTAARTPDAKPVYANIRLGALILLNVEGSERYDVQVSNAKLEPPTSASPLTVTFDVRNQSNTHVFPKATLAILDRDSRLVAKANADPRRFLPGQADQVNVSWAGTLPPGSYEGVLTVAYGGKQVQTQSLPFTIAQ